MNFETMIRTQYPSPIAKRYEIMGLETDPRLKVIKFIDLFEETLRYLCTLGLAEYSLFGISDDLVEKERNSLDKPSLGNWLSLLRCIVESLKPVFPEFLNTSLYQINNEGAIFEATQKIAPLAGMKAPDKVRLNTYLDVMVQFRNKKIGHGSLSNLEARQIVEPLGNGLSNWLDGLAILRETQLCYIDRVEWGDPNFTFSGTNLNSGTSLYPTKFQADKLVTPKRIYLFRKTADGQDRFVPLYPYMDFNNDLYLLYTYYELSNKRKPILRCFYDQTGVNGILELDVGEKLIIGDKLIINKPLEKEETSEKPAAEEPQPLAKDVYRMTNWYDVIPPHEDIRKGNFDEAIFAADLGDVADGRAPQDYTDPYLFYKKTFLTQGLKNLLGKVSTTLSTGLGSSVVQIQTPFGGGKTHALVAIYHYLMNGKAIKDLLPQDLKILSPHVVAIAGNHWNPVEGYTSDGITRRTFWGEVAFQIGGKEGYEVFRENDEARVSPGKQKFQQFLAAHQPFILLFDEILEYINRALDARSQTNVSLCTQTFSFFQELTEAVSTIPHGMMIVTLPSSNLEDYGENEEESLARLNKIFGRLESIETPVQGEEVYSVIRRRLFEVENLSQKEMRETVQRYFTLYQQYRDDLPPKARDVNYRDRMEMAYPFHPDIIDILYEKWSTYPTFQRTRGVLRMLANVIEDLYQREVPLDLILPGDINLDRPSTRQEFLKHIGTEYEGVIGSDIAGHEAKSLLLDNANKPWKHLAQRISTAIFFHSFSADDSEKGTNLSYIKLAVLHSDTIPALVTDVLGKQANMLWYLNTRGDAYYFSRIPNLNRMILDKKELFNDSYEPEMKKIIEGEVGIKLRVYLWPDNSEAIPDNRDLKLAILKPEDAGDKIPEWLEKRGNTFREFKNTLFFALADTGAFAKLREDVKTYLALGEIEDEIRSGKSPLPETKQDEVQRRIRELKRDFSFNVRRMYHSVRFGTKTFDLGQPVAGNETLSNWYWRDLTSTDQGAILTQLHYRTIVNKFMINNDQLATSVLLDQFYKNPELPVPESSGVVARAIQLGVKDGALGLAEAQTGGIPFTSLKYKTDIPLDVISFEQGAVLLSSKTCEELIAAQIKPPITSETEPAPGPKVELGTDTPPGTITGPGPQPVTDKQFTHVRLVIGDIPASKIADVNRGLLMPINRSVGDFKFTIEIDVRNSEGISQTVLDNQIKETIRQIGAKIIEEIIE